MSGTKPPETWTWEAYLAWEAEQPRKYEFVNGEVRVRDGVIVCHDTIANNLRVEIWTQLRGKPCRLHGSALKVRAGGSARYPDALIDCGPPAGGGVFAVEPVAIFDVVSRATDWIDLHFRLRDYEATPSVETYALISQDEMRALVYIRDRDGRLSLQKAILLEGADAVIEIAELDVVLRFSDLYEGVELPVGAKPHPPIPFDLHTIVGCEERGDRTAIASSVK